MMDPGNPKHDDNIESLAKVRMNIMDHIRSYKQAEEQERKDKIEIIGHIFDKLKALDCEPMDTKYGDMFDILYDSDFGELVHINYEYEIQLKEYIQFKQNRKNK